MEYLTGGGIAGDGAKGASGIVQFLIMLSARFLNCWGRISIRSSQHNILLKLALAKSSGDG